MLTVPGFLLLLRSVTARSHSHCILSTVPAQTFMWPYWESNRGIDPDKNNSAEQFLMWQGGGKVVGSRIRMWGLESRMPSWHLIMLAQADRDIRYKFSRISRLTIQLAFIALVFQEINGLKKNRTWELDAHNMLQSVLGGTGMAQGAYLLKKTENNKTYIITWSTQVQNQWVTLLISARKGIEIMSKRSSL